MDTERSKGRSVREAAGEPPPKEEILGRSLLGGLDGESRRALLDLGRPQRWPRHHALARQGDPIRELFLLGSGRVKLERVYRDRSLVLEHRGPGEMVGEGGVGGVETWGESAMVVDAVEALVFGIEALRLQLARDPALRAAVMVAIVGHQRALQERLAGLLIHGVEARVAAFLLDAASRWGIARARGLLVSAPFTHAEIAHLVGSTRETVTLTLGKLRRGGLIGFEQRRIVVRDPAGLEKRIGDSAEA